jgi:hypothetical protein
MLRSAPFAQTCAHGSAATQGPASDIAAAREPARLSPGPPISMGAWVARFMTPSSRRGRRPCTHPGDRHQVRGAVYGPDGPQLPPAPLHRPHQYAVHPRLPGPAGGDVPSWAAPHGVAGEAGDAGVESTRRVRRLQPRVPLGRQDPVTWPQRPPPPRVPIRLTLRTCEPSKVFVDPGIRSGSRASRRALDRSTWPRCSRPVGPRRRRRRVRDQRRRGQNHRPRRPGPRRMSSTSTRTSPRARSSGDCGTLGTWCVRVLNSSVPVTPLKAFRTRHGGPAGPP